MVVKGYKVKFMNAFLCLLGGMIGIACSTGTPTNKGKNGTETGKSATDTTLQAKNKFQWAPVSFDSTKKYIYLTFDDGPQHGTMICYDLLIKEGLKGTFFMVGLHTAQKSDGRKIVSLIRETYPQILLANHSYTHANNDYVDFYHHPYWAAEDMMRTQDSLNVPYMIARLPGNRSWVREGEVKATKLAAPVAQLLDSAGYNIIGWDLEWNFNRKSARPVQSPRKLMAEIDSAFAKAETHTPNHLVILSHDRMFQRPADADSLAKFIQMLKQRPEFVMETVDHYPGLKKPVLK